jgi:hypothetical protein
LTELGDTGLTQAKQRLELAALFQFTYVGAPMVFYGDEVAINSPSQSSSSNGPIGDPYGRAPYPWTDQPGDPTIYGPPDTSVESYYTKLEHLRKQYPMLRNGSFTTLLTGDTQQPLTAGSTYAFARTLGGQSAVVALNNGGSSNAASIPVGGLFTDGTELQDPFSGATYTVANGSLALTLNALSGVVLLPFPASVDLIPPAAQVSLVPPANSHGWNRDPVAVNLSATDSGGSGMNELRYWVDQGPTNVALGSSASLSISAEGESTVHLRVLDNAGNISSRVSQPVSIDLTAPTVRVSVSPSTLWPPNGKMVKVTVSGTIRDSVSGVDPNSAAFAVVDEYGSVQPHGPLTLGAGGSYTFTVLLESSRRENDSDGRHYSITVSTNDLAGNPGSAVVTVIVPHNEGH